MTSGTDTSQHTPIRSRRDTATDQRDRRLTSQLDREWRRLRFDRRALRTARSWGEPLASPVPISPALAEVLADLTDLDDLIASTHRGGHRCGDELLLDLVALARHEQLAGRIVLQRILPGLLARSRPYRDFQVGRDTADAVMAAAWITLRTYDVEHRRRHVAASLISDAVFAAFRQPRRRRSATEQLRPVESWVTRAAPEPHTSPLEELAAAIAEARRLGVRHRELGVLCDLVRTGSSTLVAAELGVSARTVRNRRDRALASVRDALQPVAA
jgi:DNA-directed RNA polymerase specialized sigma24 family protein